MKRGVHSTSFQHALLSDTLLTSQIQTADQAHWLAGWHYISTFLYYAVLVSTLASCLITFSTIWGHLKHYRRPWIQRAIIRILWMHLADYLDAMRGLYEAVVLYVFFNLLVAYLGGERQLLRKLQHRPPVMHVFPFSLLLSQWDVSRPNVFYTMKRGILQFVLLKPIFALSTLILARTSKYEHSQISFTSTYLWVSLLYNLSVSWSMYCLLVLFFASKDILAHYRPLPKFLCIKFTLMFTFYQDLLLSCLIPLLHLYPAQMEPSKFAHALNSGLLCMEMSFCARLYQAAFHFRDYPPSARLCVRDALRDALGCKDVYLDIAGTLRGRWTQWTHADVVLARLDAHRRSRLERWLLQLGIYRRFRSTAPAAYEDDEEARPLFAGAHHDSDDNCDGRAPALEDTEHLGDERFDCVDDDLYRCAVQDYGYRVIDDGDGALGSRREEVGGRWTHPYST